MPKDEPEQNVVQTCHYLRSLLIRPGEYRAKWEDAERHKTKDDINKAAVCRVIADYLVSTGYITDEQEQDYSRSELRHRVDRALAAQMLSPTLLRWFIEAFEMSEDDEARLRALFSGNGSIQYVRGDLVPHPVLGNVPREHETVLLHEAHIVGPAGSPVEHRTVQVVRAIIDGFQRYPYRFDTNALTLEVIRGGTPEEIFRINDQLYCINIRLHEALRLGETADLEYVSTFSYPEPPEPIMRRVILRRVEHLAIRVTFHPDKLPRALWWAEWDYLTGELLSRELVELDADHGKHRYLDGVEAAAVGFCWEW